MSSHRAYNRLQKIGLLFAVNFIIFSFLVAFIEIFFRFFPIVHVRWAEGNAETGFAIPPYYSEHLVYPEHPSGHFDYIANNMGFREDHDTRLVKSDSFRIVVLGDSHTDGVCYNRESYANRLEYYLNKRDKTATFEVINAGNGKYSPFQYYRAYEYRVKPLKPDLVIVGFYIGNDFFDMFRRDDRPYLQLMSDGSIEEKAPVFYFYTPPGFTSTWRSKSYCYYFIFGSRFWKSISYNLTRALVFYRNFSHMDGTSSATVLHYFADIYKLSRIHRHATTQSLAQYAFFHYFPNKRRESFLLLRYTFAKFADETNLLVMPIPTKFEIEDERIGDLHRRLSEKFSYLTPDQPQSFEDQLYRDVLVLFRELNIRTLDIRAVLSNAARTRQLYYQTDFHINPAAHDIIGATLCDTILAQKDQFFLGN